MHPPWTQWKPTRALFGLMLAGIVVPMVFFFARLPIYPWLAVYWLALVAFPLIGWRLGK